MAYDSAEEERVSYERSISSIVEHTRVVQDSLRLVLATADAVKAGNEASASSSYEKLVALKESDEMNIRKRVEQTLASAQLISNYAASLLSADDLVTEVSSFAEAVSFRLSALSKNGFCKEGTPTPDELKFLSGVSDIVETAFNAFENAKSALQMLKTDSAKAVQKTYEVDTVEAEVDRKQRELDITVLNFKAGFPCIILMHETVQRAEELMDAIQRLASAIRILALMR